MYFLLEGITLGGSVKEDVKEAQSKFMLVTNKSFVIFTVTTL